MTRSEQICNEIGAKFFCKDYVYENLKYFNSSNNKLELCDGLFEYSKMYVVLQIKERSSQKGTKNDEDWLREIVYGEAVDQAITTVAAIKNNNIAVNDLYHQSVQLHSNYLIFPIVIFDNIAIKEYERVVNYGEFKINVFSLSDYKTMMEVLIHPFDIIYYLQERSVWVEKSNHLPNFVFGENESTTIIAKISNEADFANFFIHYIYDGEFNKQEDALRLLSIIENFRKNQIKKNPNYKNILDILQMVEPKIASAFMERFQNAWSNACEDKFDFSKAIQLQLDDKKISIVFFSVGLKNLNNPEYYRIICDAKQQQQKADIVLLISFIGNTDNTCKIDWVYFEQQLIEEPNALEWYDANGMFGGTINRKRFDVICHYLIGDNG